MKHFKHYKFQKNVLVAPLREEISVFSLNTGKYGPEKIPYLDTFHTVYTSAEYRLSCISE